MNKYNLQRKYDCVAELADEFCSSGQESPWETDALLHLLCVKARWSHLLLQRWPIKLLFPVGCDTAAPHARIGVSLKLIFRYNFTRTRLFNNAVHVQHRAALLKNTHTTSSEGLRLDRNSPSQATYTKPGCHHIRIYKRIHFSDITGCLLLKDLNAVLFWDFLANLLYS